MVAAVPAPVLEKIVAKIPVGRLGQASEIARGVAFLCSEEAGFVTGSTMSINGGTHLYCRWQARKNGVRAAHGALGAGPGTHTPDGHAGRQAPAGRANPAAATPAAR